MFAAIRKYFAQEYHFFDKKLELNNRYQRSINSYFVHGKKENEGNLVHIDELYEASTYNTDYLLIKKENYEKAIRALENAGYTMIE